MDYTNICLPSIQRTLKQTFKGNMISVLGDNLELTRQLEPVEQVITYVTNLFANSVLSTVNPLTGKPWGRFTHLSVARGMINPQAMDHDLFANMLQGAADELLVSLGVKIEGMLVHSKLQRKSQQNVVNAVPYMEAGRLFYKIAALQGEEKENSERELLLILGANFPDVVNVFAHTLARFDVFTQSSPHAN